MLIPKDRQPAWRLAQSCTWAALLLVYLAAVVGEPAASPLKAGAGVLLGGALAAIVFALANAVRDLLEGGEIELPSTPTPTGDGE